MNTRGSGVASTGVGFGAGCVTGLLGSGTNGVAVAIVGAADATLSTFLLALVRPHAVATSAKTTTTTRS